jgi:hypothetical protein
MNVTTRYLLGIVLAPAILLAPAPGSAEPQQVAYPEVKVVLEKPYKPDAAFDKMNGAFLDAVQRKDLSTLAALVAPTFVWTVSDHLSDELDLGRDAIHNFKVAFGFRAPGEDVDGGVDDGPDWDALSTFAEEPTFYIANAAGTLVCGPASAQVVDDNAFDQARRKIIVTEADRMVLYSCRRNNGRQGTRRYGHPRRHGRGNRDAAGRLLSTGERRRTAAGTNSFRGAAAFRPDGLGVGQRRTPA